MKSYMPHNMQTHVAHVTQSYMAHDMQNYMSHVMQTYTHVMQTYKHVMQSHMAHGDEFCVLLFWALSGRQLILPFEHIKVVESYTGNHATERRM
jgi:hypothetical protein